MAQGIARVRISGNIGSKFDLEIQAFHQERVAYALSHHLEAPSFSSFSSTLSMLLKLGLTEIRKERSLQHRIGFRLKIIDLLDQVDQDSQTGYSIIHIF